MLENMDSEAKKAIREPYNTTVDGELI